jgi:hypothetical protein
MTRIELATYGSTDQRSAIELQSPDPKNIKNFSYTLACSCNKNINVFVFNNAYAVYALFSIQRNNAYAVTQCLYAERITPHTRCITMFLVENSVAVFYNNFVPYGLVQNTDLR